MVDVRTDTDGPIQIIRYGNPPHHYMTSKGALALIDAVQAASDDPAIRAIILTGTDDVFVRHFDVGELVNAGEAVAAGALTEKAFETGPFLKLQDLCEAAPKPVLAAINGTCMGGGFELALACDFRIAAASVTQIGLPETRVSIFPGGGGTQRLPRVIGEAAALDFILRGKVVGADEAEALGLVHETAPDAVARAMEIALEMAKRGAEGLAMAKLLVRSALNLPLQAGLQEERHGFFDVLKSERAMADMKAFQASDRSIDEL